MRPLDNAMVNMENVIPYQEILVVTHAAPTPAWRGADRY
jgi:hypothetical protein